VVVNDLDFVGISSLPSEAHAVLIVDSDAVLARAITAQAFEVISGRHR